MTAYPCEELNDEPCVNDAHKGDIGSEILIELVDCGNVVDGEPQPVDLTNAVAHVLKVEKPSGAVAEWSTTIHGDPTLGVLRYITVEGDLDEAGTYVLQVYLEIPGWKGHTAKFALVVNPVIESPE